MKRYAQDTTVSVASSRGEITGILAKHGVERMGWQTGPEADHLMFEYGDKSYRLAIKKPTPGEIRERDRGEYVYPHNVDWDTKSDQEWRRRWRATVLLLKAKLEFAADGETSTMEYELLPYLVTAGGETLGDLVLQGSVPLLGGGE